MKTKYKITAATGYAGHAEGDEVELDLTEAEEKRALERGSLKKATTTKKNDKEDDDG